MKQAFKRIRNVTGCGTQVTLAEFLDIKQSSISDAKRRNSIPPEWLIKIFRLKNIHPDWILTGEGPKYLLPSETATPPHLIRIVEVRPPAECSAQDLINELVRRALKNDDFDGIQKEVVDSWLPINKEEGKS